MSGQWHYTEDGAQYGPVDEAEIIRLIQEGELPIGTPVLQEGHTDWQPARDHACFQVEIYPKRKRTPVQAAKPTASKPVTGGASPSAGQAGAPPIIASSSPEVTPVIVKEKSVLPWVVAGVACIALGLGYWLGLPDKDSEVNSQPTPTPTPAPPKPKPPPTPVKPKPTLEVGSVYEKITIYQDGLSKSVRYTFLDNGIYELHVDGVRSLVGSRKWSLVDNEVHIVYSFQSKYSHMIQVWRINNDNSITRIASIRNGVRHDRLKNSLGETYKRIKLNHPRKKGG